MKRRRRIILAAFVLVVVVALCVLLVPSGPPDPIYDGKHLSYWLKVSYLHEHWGIPRHPADLSKYPAIDSEAVPRLLEALHQQDARWHELYAKFRAGSPRSLENRLPPTVPAQLVRDNAAFMLGNPKFASTEILTALTQAVKSDKKATVRMTAMESLAILAPRNPDAIKTVAGALQDKELFEIVPYILKAMDRQTVSQVLDQQTLAAILEKGRE